MKYRKNLIGKWCDCDDWKNGKWKDFDFGDALFCGFCGKKLIKVLPDPV